MPLKKRAAHRIIKNNFCFGKEIKMKLKKLMLFAAASLTSVILLAGCTTKYEGDIVTFEGNADINISTNDGSEENKAETPETDVTEDNKEEDAALDEDTETKCELEDGIYLADFTTDGSMFHVNEMCDGKGELKVENGVMTIHISLTSKNILNLYPGLAEDAQKDGAELLQPTVDTIDYGDGTTDEVNGFDVPVPYLDEEFDLAIIGTKGKWYDHKVFVSNPVLKDEAAEGAQEEKEALDINDGDYTIEVTLEGGSGKATITSPCKINVVDGKTIATIEWSSPNYDYMLVGDEKYLPVNEEGSNSVFEIPVDLSVPNVVIADTVAMSKPHEVEYTLTFDNDTLK